MLRPIPPFVLLDDARDGGAAARLYTQPVEIITAHRIEQVPAALDALLDNVFSHTADAVTLRVSVSAGPDGGGRLSVEDAGAGLPVNAAARQPVRVAHRWMCWAAFTCTPV